MPSPTYTGTVEDIFGRTVPISGTLYDIHGDVGPQWPIFLDCLGPGHLTWPNNTPEPIFVPKEPTARPHN